MRQPFQGLSVRSTAIALACVVGIAFAGVFLGVNDGVPRHDEVEMTFQGRHEHHPPESDVKLPAAAGDPAAIPATHYSQMRRSEFGATSRPLPSLGRFHAEQEFERCITCHHPHTFQVRPNQADKLNSLAIRSQRRAFNGAPPVIPHAVEQTNDEACYACHGGGAIVGQLVANEMPHGRLSNCIQCHVASPPRFLTDSNSAVETKVSNSFAGLPAPRSGPRAFQGAPPSIPHSTWMRERCLSCHGGKGWPGLEVTHRWRANCLQCHATSAPLEQTIASHSFR